ncbi:MAG: hypothetical protein RBT20_04085 [Syntrophales bacterium]|nr:hypothetical protein [Syntrophales bacterium]
MRNNAPSWTEKETEAMQEFINVFPDERVTTAEMHPVLAGKFPGRTVEAIYHKWRRMKGLVRRRKQSTPSESNDVLASFGEFLTAYVNRQVEKRTASLIEENEQLKQLLRKLKRLREAAEEFKL